MGTEYLPLTFSRPAWLLVLLPALALCWLLYQRSQRRSGWEALLPLRMQQALLERETNNRPRARYLLLGGVWLIAVIALAGPSWSLPLETNPENQAAIVLVLEVTPAMLATDVPPSRLQRARHKVHDVIRLAADHQLALIAYAGSAHRVTPLSHDRATLTNLLGALEPDIMPAEGRDLDAALTLAREMLAGLPPSSSQVLLLTSGADAGQLQALERHAGELGAQLAILGVGTQTGAPVPGAGGGFQRDEAGRILVPRLDSQALAGIARRHGAAYHGVTTTDQDLEHLLPLRQYSAVAAEQQQMILRDQGHWLVLLLVPLAALGARRGWLGLILLASISPLPAEAAWADWWQRRDQQGAALLEQRRPLEAAQRFEDVHWRAWALYQAEHYAAASDAYAQVVAGEPEDAENHFEYGTALAMAGRYEAALEAFEQALTRDPEHQAARHNRNRVEALLEELRKQADQAGEPSPPDGDTQSDARADDTEPSQETQKLNEAEQVQDAAQDSAAASAGSTADAVSALAQDATAPSATGVGDSAGQATVTDPADAVRQAEQAQSLRQWLEDIPDNPAELLRRKFLYQHMQQQQGSRP